MRPVLLNMYPQGRPVPSSYLWQQKRNIDLGIPKTQHFLYSNLYFLLLLSILCVILTNVSMLQFLNHHIFMKQKGKHITRGAPEKNAQQTAPAWLCIWICNLLFCSWEKMRYTDLKQINKTQEKKKKNQNLSFLSFYLGYQKLKHSWL